MGTLAGGGLTTGQGNSERQIHITYEEKCNIIKSKNIASNLENSSSLQNELIFKIGVHLH